MPGSSESSTSNPSSNATWPLIFRNLPHLLQSDTIAWEPLREGIDISLIYNNDSSGPRAAFLRYAPGAKLERHRHKGYEHILLLSGSQIDENGEYAAGTLLINPPGSFHSVTSPRGCLVLAIWTDGVSFEP